MGVLSHFTTVWQTIIERSATVTGIGFGNSEDVLMMALTGNARNAVSVLGTMGKHSISCLS